jgi:hypothetical protein
MLVAPSMLRAPPGPAGTGYELSGSPSLLSTSQGKAVIVKLSPEWYGTESDNRSNYWNWAPGNTTITLINPHAVPLQTRLRFGLSAIGQRTVRLRLGAAEIWQTTVPAVSEVTVKLSDVVLQPGLNRLEFLTDTAPDMVGVDPRPLAFSLRNMKIEVQQLLPAPPPGK